MLRSASTDRTMRLTTEQRQRIRRAAARTLGESATVRLFGSRLDDAARGGDIDLFVELDGDPAELLERELSFYAALQRELGEQRIDIVVHRRGSALRPIDREALRNGVVL
jgi:predicted nucleotidyltransferase